MSFSLRVLIHAIRVLSYLHLPPSHSHLTLMYHHQFWKRKEQAARVFAAYSCNGREIRKQILHTIREHESVIETELPEMRANMESFRAPERHAHGNDRKGNKHHWLIRQQSLIAQDASSIEKKMKRQTIRN